jgi:hypothetical protein
MKCVICTGMTGSERRQYLNQLKAFVKEGEGLEILDPWFITKELHTDINEATILNINDEDRLAYFKDSYRIIAGRLDELRKQPNDGVAVVPMHSVFYWKSTFKDAVKDEFVEWLSPDLFITIVHNMRAVKENLDSDAYARFPDITFPEILFWRLRETQETSRWAESFRKPHVVVARNEPLETLHGVLFTKKKRIYFSYPMSHVTAREMSKAKKLIRKLRNMEYIVFDPDSIEDAKYIGELDKQLRAETGPIRTRDELSNIAKIVGEHTVGLDYQLINQSDMVVVRYPSVEYQKYIVEKDKVTPAMYVPLSAGVICEMVRGHYSQKKVFAVWLPEVEPSPFFKYQCFKLFGSEQELLDYLAEREPSSPRK